MAASIKAFIVKYASAPTPPSPLPSPLSPLSSPLSRIPSLPIHTSPTYVSAQLGYRAAMVQLRGTSPLPVPSPPLLLPSADHMGDIPETDMSFWKRLYLIPKTDMPFLKRLCLTALASRFEVGESSTATTARQTGHTLARRVDYGFIDTMDASIRASKSRVMTVVEEVNKRQDVVYARQAWSRSKDRSTTLEALIMAHEARTTTLEAQTGGLQREVRILQKSQENGQSRTITDTGKEREYKSRKNDIKGQQKSTLGQH
ncbi:hypothetical protein Tco_1553810 [Tanacetum coccineum]